MYYRVNTENGLFSQDKLVQYDGLGGRALTSRIVYSEVGGDVHPLGPQNKLVIATGLLTGTGAPNSGRMSLGARSPLTGGVKESNVGGVMGFKLGRLGINAIIVEGAPEKEKTFVLRVDKNGLSLDEMPELKGLNIYATVERLHNRYGPKVAVGCIGVAGENRMLAACIGFTDLDGHPSRQAGRGGLGAVMGSKGLKAIVVDDSGADGSKLADAEGFRAGSKKLVAALQSHPVTSQALPALGTNVGMSVINEVGALPTNNFKYGKFAGIANVSGEKLAETLQERGGKAGHACSPGCIIRCSNVYNDEKRQTVTAGFEYESCWALGANCGIDNLDDIAYMNRLCDDYGVDTIEAGCAIAIAMEAGLANFGDSKAAIGLLEEIGKATPLGRIIGSGAAVTGKVFGMRRVPATKGQAMAAYDPRAIKGIGVTYATSTMGADHTAGYSIANNVFGLGGEKVEPLSRHGQVELSRNQQILAAFIDSTGLCLFVTFACADNQEGMAGIVEMCNARYGWSYSLNDYMNMGRRVLEDERSFNKSAGLGDETDDLPEFFRLEPISPLNAVFDIPASELKRVHGMAAGNEAEQQAAAAKGV